MSKFHKHISFLKFLLSCSINQKKAILQNLSHSQKLVLKEIALNIVKKIIPVSKRVIKSLFSYRFFLRKLSASKVCEITNLSFSRNCKCICQIIKISFNYHGTSKEIKSCKQTGFSSIRGMGNFTRKETFDQSSSDEYEKNESEDTGEDTGEASDCDSITSKSSNSSQESSVSDSQRSSSFSEKECDSGSENENENEPKRNE
jgi:hypothetical protein